MTEKMIKANLQKIFMEAYGTELSELCLVDIIRAVRGSRGEEGISPESILQGDVLHYLKSNLPTKEVRFECDSGTPLPVLDLRFQINKAMLREGELEILEIELLSENVIF